MIVVDAPTFALLCEVSARLDPGGVMMVDRRLTEAGCQNVVLPSVLHVAFVLVDDPR